MCTSRHPHVHPGTAAVNQTACNFPIKGRAFAIALHSKPEKPTVNISNRKLQDLQDSLQYFRSKESPDFPLQILVSNYSATQFNSSNASQ